VVQVVTHVETTPSVASRQLKQRMSRKHAWDAIERGTIIMAWEAVAHVDVVVEIVDSTIVNIVQESTLRIRIGHFHRKSILDYVRVDTLHGWLMCVGIMAVVRTITEVVVTDVVDVDMVERNWDARFHFWNMCHRKDRQQQRNRIMRCSINGEATLGLVLVVVATETDRIADFLSRCRCGWCRGFSFPCFIFSIIFSGRRQLECEY
jgi:hypothetical protein